MLRKKLLLELPSWPTPIINRTLRTAKKKRNAKQNTTIRIERRKTSNAIWVQSNDTAK